MHAAITLLSIALPAAIAYPQNTIPPSSKARYCPVVDSVTDVTGDAWQVGVSGKGGATLTITETHEVGTSWTKGFDLGVSVDKIIGVGAGLSGSVSKTVADSTAEGVEYECPDGDWHCSVMVYPGMKLVKGHLEEMKGNDAGCSVSPSDHGGDFELKIPRSSAGGNKKSSVQLCTCKNLDHWADPGHEALLCQDNCVKPN